MDEGVLQRQGRHLGWDCGCGRLDGERQQLGERVEGQIDRMGRFPKGVLGKVT